MKFRFLLAWLCCLLAVPWSRAGIPAFGVPEQDLGIAIEQTAPARYPPSMLQSGVYSGEVRAMISVNSDGDLTDCLVTAYTDKAFAVAAEHALRLWRYEPARIRGRARASRAEVVFMFRNEGVSVQSLPGAIERHLLLRMLEERYSYRPCQLRELDRIPTPVQVVPPAVRLEDKTRSVTVEFYIDEEGRVRMPAVERESADDLLAAAAVAAVEQWRFEPPLRKGRPVLVYAQQEFNFKAREPAR